MAEALKLERADYLLPALKKAGLADPVSFLGCSPPGMDDGLRFSPVTAAFDRAVRYVEAKIRREDTGLPVESVVVRALRGVVRHLLRCEEKNMARLGDADRDDGDGIDRAIDHLFGDNPGRGGDRVDRREEYIRICDELLRTVTAQNNGRPVRIELEPSSGDLLASYYGFHRDVPRAVGIAALELKGRLESSLDDGQPHSKAKVFAHERGKSVDGEADLFTDWVTTHAFGGAFALPERIAPRAVDGSSGVARLDGQPGDQALMAEYLKLRELCETMRAFMRATMRCSDGAKIAKHFVDIAAKEVNEVLREPGSFTAAVDEVTRRRARIGDEARAEALTEGASDRKRPANHSGGGGGAKKKGRPDRRDPSPRRSSPRRGGGGRGGGGGSGGPGGGGSGGGGSGGGGSSGRGSQPSRPGDNLCHKWAKHLFTRTTGDDCSYGRGKCKYNHSFANDAEEKWAADKFGA
jgi:uncharacterized membrane protein YgcG